MARLSPAATSQQTLTAVTNIVTEVNAYANAIAQITINSVTDPPASWYQPLVDTLTTAQSHASNWIETIGPDVSASIPGAILRYSNTFNNTVNDIEEILTAGNCTPDSSGTCVLTAEQRTHIMEMIERLQHRVAELVTQLGGGKTELAGFHQNITADAQHFSTGTYNVQKVLGLDEKDIIRMQGDITQLNVDMAAANMKATESEIGIGLSIFVGLCAVALVVASAGTGAIVVVGVVAVVGLGASIGTTVVFNKEVESDLRQIAADQAELTADQAQATALEHVITSMKGIVAANQKAQDQMTKVLLEWKDLQTDLTSVQTDLQSAHDDASSKAFAGVFSDLQDAQSDWQTLKAFAMNVETMLATTTVTTITPPTSS